MFVAHFKGFFFLSWHSDLTLEFVADALSMDVDSESFTEVDQDEIVQGILQGEHQDAERETQRGAESAVR